MVRYPDSNHVRILNESWQIRDGKSECSILNTRICSLTGTLQLSCSVNGAVPQWHDHNLITPLQPIIMDYKPVGTFCVTGCLFVTSDPTVLSSVNMDNKGHDNVENRVVEERYE